MVGVTEFPPWTSKSTQMDSPWLDTGSYSVRMKCNAPRRLSRYLPDPPDTIQNWGKTTLTKKKSEIPENSATKKNIRNPLSGGGTLAGLFAVATCDAVP